MWDRAQAKQDTIAEIRMAVDLRAEVKGTHMSRFLEILDEHSGELTQQHHPRHAAADLQQRLDTDDAQISVCLPLLPAALGAGHRRHRTDGLPCQFTAALTAQGLQFTLQVRGAGHQRLSVLEGDQRLRRPQPARHHHHRVHARGSATANSSLIWIEELIDIAESVGLQPGVSRCSSGRRAARHDGRLRQPGLRRGHGPRGRRRACAPTSGLPAFTVEAVNDESIHNHAAFARLSHPANSTHGQDCGAVVTTGRQRLHIVVTCANRKRVAVPAALRLRRTPGTRTGQRAVRWIERIAAPDTDARAGA